MDKNQSNEHIIIKTVVLMVAIIAGLAALINNLNTITNSEFALRTVEYISIFWFDLILIITVLILTFFTARLSKTIHSIIKTKDYFNTKPLTTACVLTLCTLLLAYNAYYQYMFYKRGMTIKINNHKKLLINKTNSLHNQGAITEAIDVLKRCNKIFNYHKCKELLNDEETLIKDLDTALWLYNITPYHSPYKQTLLKIIQKLEGNKIISIDLQIALENKIKRLNTKFFDGLTAIKSYEFELALKILSQLNKEEPGYMNSHLFVHELNKITKSPIMPDKIINNTTYVSTVMRSDSLELIIDQLDIYDNIH